MKLIDYTRCSACFRGQMCRDEFHLFGANEKVADSITHLNLEQQREKHSYPEEVDKLLGSYRKLFARHQKLIRLNAQQKKKLRETRNRLQERETMMTRDLLLAREIQEQFLPQSKVEILGCKFHSVYVPMDTVGGDFFDFIQLDDEKIGIFVSDVSGHGISAALITAMIKANLHYENHLLHKPLDFLLELQHKMVPLLIDKYFTAFYGVINVKEKTFTYSNCAHLKQLVYHKKTGKVEGMHLRGPIIGICAFPRECFLEKTIPLSAGDRLYFYTDGIVEVFQGERSLSHQFGPEGVAGVISRYPFADPEEQMKQIIAGAQAFQNKKEFADDIAVIVVEFE